MSDFEQFMKKIRVAIRCDRDDGERVRDAMLTLLFAKLGQFEGADKGDAIAPDELTNCYVEITNYLLEHAAKRGALDIFTDVLSEKLAQTAFGMGTPTIDEITAKLGAHLKCIRAGNEADMEAAHAAERVYECGESARFLN